MANRLLEKLWAVERDAVAIFGSFAPNGSSALVATSTYGKGFTVARTTIGIYTVTFDDWWVRLLYADAHLQLHTLADVEAQVGDFTQATTSAKATLVLTAQTAGSAVEVAAAANNRMNFLCVFDGSAVVP